MRSCELRNLHLVAYENGTRLQQKLVEMRQRDELPDQLLLLEHPATVTLGRGGKAGNLLVPHEELETAGIRFFETTRGGDITYHGPGQLVVYPILHLGEGRRDVRKYVTQIEEVLIRTVAGYGITAGRIEGRHGIWVGNDKLAAIGVRIARWVTSHGFALNVTTDLSHFRFITPCGLPGTGVTSLARELGRNVPMREVREIVAAKFAEVFERDLQPVPHTIALVKVLLHDDDRVLLLHRRPERGNFWQPLTGTIEPHEEPAETARREIIEETGQIAEPVATALVQSFLIESAFLAARYGTPVVASEIGFMARLDSSVPIVVDPAEHDEYGWFTFGEAYERIRWPDDREALQRLETSLGVAAAALPADALVCP